MWAGETMWDSPERIISPWSDDQVESIKAYQEQVPTGVKYVCERKSNHRALIPTELYLECPNCDYRTYWAYSIALDWTWKEKLELHRPPSKSKPYTGGYY
jgi:hypothetical protein